MTGYYRFILATFVYTSHFLSSFNLSQNINIGVFAVIIFYILAGHVIAKIFEELFKRDILQYYKDRFLRIYPSYIISFLFVTVFVFSTDFGQPKVDIVKLLTNITIIPLNYFMFIPEYVNVLNVDGISWNFIPPAWSLGAEIQVYLILPFIIVSRYLFFITFLTTLTIFLLAKLSLIDPDIYGYRLLVGVLFIFLTGIFLQRTVVGKTSKMEKTAFIIFFTIFIIITIFILFGYKNYGIFTIETSIGYIFGTVTVYTLLKINKKIKFDNIMGLFSYGIFLNHFTAIWIYKYLNIDLTPVYAFIVIFIITVILSIPAVILDSFILRYRKKIR